MNIRNDRATWIKGSTATCNIPPRLRLQPPRLVMLGSPGLGKGTQAEFLCNGLEICHLATGDINFTTAGAANHNGTPASNTTPQLKPDGRMLPDHTALKLIQERLTCLHCRGGFLLDGFPRTVLQAETLDQLLREEQLRLSAVLHYTLPFETVVKRCSDRRTCQQCQAAYHLGDHPPVQPGICDHCGGILSQHEADRPEAVEARLQAYENEIKPLIEFYLGHGLLRTISAEGSPERIFQRTLAILDN